MATRMVFGNIIKRNYCKKFTDMSFMPGYKPYKDIDKTVNLWRFVSICIGVPVVIIAAVNAYLVEKEFHETFKRPEYVPYEYRGIINKPFPWGDGKHPFFFNAKRNPIRGVGYEEPWDH